MDKINFIPSVWGSSAWKFLHIIALSFPKNASQQIKNDYKSFFLSLDKILPCEKCQKHFQKNKNKFPIEDYLNDPHDLFSWTVKIRNEVQKSLNKPLWDELKLRDSLYNENEKAGTIFDISPKFKLILFIISIILVTYGISKFFKVKITPKK